MNTAKVFINGGSQAVRLPKDCRFDSDEVYVRRIHDMIILIPKQSAWRIMEESLAYFTDDFMADRRQPDAPKREDL